MLKNPWIFIVILLFSCSVGGDLEDCRAKLPNQDTPQDNPVVVNIEMVWVPGGDFKLGKELGTAGYGDTTPVSDVTLTGFHIGKYPVTQEQYKAVMGTNPSYFTVANGRSPASGETDTKRPVEDVSWYDAIEFCNKLSDIKGLTPYYNINKIKKDPNNLNEYDNIKWLITKNTSASGYRLPTEAQWEYTAKGGTPGNFTYAGSDTVDDVAWYDNNSDSQTHEVGRKAQNGLGIYDMSGNVWEWCWDWYGTYTGGTDPTGAPSGTKRVLRGGYWSNYTGNIRSVYRSGHYPYGRIFAIGFRVSLP